MEHTELLAGAWVTHLNDDDLLSVETLIQKELSARRALANQCYENERKTRVPYIGSLLLVVTWVGVVLCCFMFGLAILLAEGKLSPIAGWLIGGGVVLAIPLWYFRKRNRAFTQTFRTSFPREAGLLGWK